MMTRQSWIAREDGVSVAQQCVLAGVSRATVYARQRPMPVDEIDLVLSGLIDGEYTRRPFYGSRKMVIFLRVAGHSVNRKRVQWLMRQMGLAGMAPRPNTSRAHPDTGRHLHLLLIEKLQQGMAAAKIPRVIGQREPVARSRQIDGHDLAGARPRAVRHHHDAIGQQHRIVDVMGHHHDGTLGRFHDFH